MPLTPCANPAVLSTITEIILTNEGIREFWSSAHGWAPTEAADLLNRSRLDRQVSLSHTLIKWTEPCEPEAVDGCLILAWANLRALVEGTLKWFLSVYEGDYSDSPAMKRGKAQQLDEMQLDELRRFFGDRVWTDGEKGRWNDFVQSVQQRGNGIHAYKDRPMGGFLDFETGLKEYWEFLVRHEKGVPYPDRPRWLEY